MVKNKKFFGFIFILTISALFLLVGVNGKAFAVSIGASDDPNNPAITTFHDLPTGGVFVGSNPDPYNISYDSNAGRWIKEFNILMPDPFAQPYNIVEFLQVSGTQNWIGWYEEIITPGWTFLDVNFLAPFFGPPDFMPPGYQMDFNANSVTFTFNPISPESGLIINPSFYVSGSSGVLEIAAYPIVGNQVPIPEPATILLLGSGLIGLAGFKRKFRKR
jgi:hypothetical protein